MSELDKDLLAAGEQLFERPWLLLKSVPALEFLPPADRIEIAFGDVTVVRSGIPAEHDATRLIEVMAAAELVVTVSLNQGTGRATVWTCDLTAGYVEINK